MKARFSQYLKAAYDLNFEAEEQPARGARARRRSELAAAPGRDRILEAPPARQRPGRRTPCSVPGMPSPPCPATSSPPRRRTSSVTCSRPSSPKPPPSTRSSPGPCWAARSRTWARSSRGTRPSSPSSESRWKEHAARSPGSAAGALPEPEWESLRQSLFGPNGSLAISADAMRFVLDQGQRDRLARLNGAIQQINATHPGAPARAMVLNDAPKPVEPHVFLRGNPGRPGPAVPRRFLRLLSGPGRQPFQKGSGRLELAQAIADAGNPLTARVLVNRVWQWHFGKGLGHHAQRLRAAQRPADPSRAARPSGRRSSWPRAGRSRRCTGGSCSRARTSSAATPGPPRSSATRRTGCCGGSIASDSTSRRCATRVLAVAGALGPALGGPSDADHRAGVFDAAHALRLHRPPEPRRSLSDVRLRRAGRDQPAAVRDDGPAASPVPDEQPVPARASPPAGRDEPISARARPRPSGSRTRPRASAGCIAASSAARPIPTSWRWPPSSSAGKPRRLPADPRHGGSCKPSRPSHRSHPGNS